jgi:LemA protein
MTGVLIGVGAAVLLVLLYVIVVYNSMISMRNRVDESWSGIYVKLKRRHDLVPNLVETVKGYASHERELMENVTHARAEAIRAKDPADTAVAEGKLSAVLGDLRAVAESYPALRATENFQQLTRELSGVEDEVQASRRIYNSNVQAYNTRIQSYPASLVAGATGFRARELFEISDPGEREPVKVSF